MNGDGMNGDGSSATTPATTWRDRIDTVAPAVLVLGGFISSPPMYRGLRRHLLDRGASAVVVAPIWLPDWLLAAVRCPSANEGAV